MLRDICVWLALGMVVLSMALGVVRLWRGPVLADRVVALDMMTIALIAFCGLFSVTSGGGSAWLDIAVTLALVSFVSVVALARYAGRLQRREDGHE